MVETCAWPRITWTAFGVDSVDQAEYDEITSRLRGLMILLGDRMSANHRGVTRSGMGAGAETILLDWKNTTR